MPLARSTGWLGLPVHENQASALSLPSDNNQTDQATTEETLATAARTSALGRATWLSRYEIDVDDDDDGDGKNKYRTAEP